MLSSMASRDLCYQTMNTTDAYHATRKHFRKTFRTAGRMAIKGGTVELMTRDVSINGIKVHVGFDPQVSHSMPARIFLDECGSQAQAKVIWSKPDYEGGWYIGLKLGQFKSAVDILEERSVHKEESSANSMEAPSLGTEF